MPERSQENFGLEAEAGCAEAAVKIAGGLRPDYPRDELIDDLTYAVPRGGGLGPGPATEIARTVCAELAAQVESCRSQRLRGRTLADRILENYPQRVPTDSAESGSPGEMYYAIIRCFMPETS